MKVETKPGIVYIENSDLDCILKQPPVVPTNIREYLKQFHDPSEKSRRFIGPIEGDAYEWIIEQDWIIDFNYFKGSNKKVREAIEGADMKMRETEAILSGDAYFESMWKLRHKKIQLFRMQKHNSKKEIIRVPC